MENGLRLEKTQGKPATSTNIYVSLNDTWPSRHRSQPSSRVANFDKNLKIPKPKKPLQMYINNQTTASREENLDF